MSGRLNYIANTSEDLARQFYKARRERKIKMSDITLHHGLIPRIVQEIESGRRIKWMEFLKLLKLYDKKIYVRLVDKTKLDR